MRVEVLRLRRQCLTSPSILGNGRKPERALYEAAHYFFLSFPDTVATYIMKQI